MAKKKETKKERKLEPSHMFLGESTQATEYKTPDYVDTLQLSQPLYILSK